MACGAIERRYLVATKEVGLFSESGEVDVVEGKIVAILHLYARTLIAWSRPISNFARCFAMLLGTPGRVPPAGAAGFLSKRASGLVAGHDRPDERVGRGVGFALLLLLLIGSAMMAG